MYSNEAKYGEYAYKLGQQYGRTSNGLSTSKRTKNTIGQKMFHYS